MRGLLIFALVYLLCGAVTVLITLYIERHVEESKWLSRADIIALYFIWPLIVALCYVPRIAELAHKKWKRRQNHGK